MTGDASRQRIREKKKNEATKHHSNRSHTREHFVVSCSNNASGCLAWWVVDRRSRGSSSSHSAVAWCVLPTPHKKQQKRKISAHAKLNENCSCSHAAHSKLPFVNVRGVASGGASIFLFPTFSSPWGGVYGSQRKRRSCGAGHHRRRQLQQQQPPADSSYTHMHTRAHTTTSSSGSHHTRQRRRVPLKKRALLLRPPPLARHTELVRHAGLTQPAASRPTFRSEHMKRTPEDREGSLGSVARSPFPH